MGLWGMELAFGDVVDNMKHQRPIIPALAALAWGEARRRAYWETELLNALVIVDRGWAQPDQMIGSWAGAMGHTAWMPEFSAKHGRRLRPRRTHQSLQPGRRPGRHGALPHQTRKLQAARRTVGRRGQATGRVQDRAGRPFHVPPGRGLAESGLAPARGGRLPALGSARLWLPVDGGPAFLIGQNFFAVRSYNPSFNYSLAIVHLGYCIRGEDDFVQEFPGGERALTLAAAR